MRVHRELTAGAGTRLFAAYAVASLVPVLLLGVVLFRDYRQQGVDRALVQGRAQASVIEEMAIAPVLGKRDLAAGLRPAERRRLLDATDLAIFSGSVVRLRVRSFGGRVVFSDDGFKGGALPTSDPAFRAAVAGKQDVAIVGDALGIPGEVIRVLQPIVPNASGRATGILEVYLPYALIAARVKAQLHRTYVRLAGGLGGLYLVLALISWSSTWRLRRHAADREYQALHDALTHLPNREWFRLRAERAIRGARAGEGGAIALLDLDRFKEVNDTLGHHAGDELLRVLARRLTAAARTDDVVARLGGDEFALVLPGVTDAGQALELLTRIRAELAVELTLDGVELSVESSCGIALYPEHGTTVEDLLKRADSAMYEAKHGTRGVVVYESPTVPRVAHRLVTQTAVRHALERNELVLHYQPKIDLATGRVSGMEALVRWQHPHRGLLGPGEFLPAVEQSDLIEPLTAWILRRALDDHGDWTTCGAPWSVSVNVSARNLDSPEFPQLVMRLLAETGTPAQDLCLEITETALAADAARADRAVVALAGCGVTVSVDDFGMGYSSLSSLRTLPVGEVKVDRAFVVGLQHSDQDRSIVRSMIELGHGLGCSVTVEGVESAEVAEWLRAAECDCAQGFHFARPAPWPDLLERFGAPLPAPPLATTTT